MSVTRKLTGSALSLAAALLVANAVQAQSPPAKTAAQPAIGPEAIFARWDKDKNKALSLDEFNAGWQEVQMTAALRRLHDNFQTMDANRSGGLDASEYAKLELVKKAGKAAPAMSAFDADKNQSLDFKEYVGTVNAMLKNAK